MERITSKKIAYKGKTMQIEDIYIDLGNGHKVNWERTSFARNVIGSVGIVALNDKKEIVLIRYFHPGSEEKEICLPGGGVNPGQTFREAVKAELIEETGLRPEKITYLTKLRPIPGYLRCETELYLAQDLKNDRSLEGDEVEDIEILYLPINKALKMIGTGEIKDSRTVAGIFFVKEFHGGELA
jgi:ADP-ribose pyrophosphatase